MANIGSLYAYIGADTTGLTLAQKNVSSFVTKSKANFLALNSAITSLSVGFAGMAVVAGFTKIIKSGMEYERVMTTVKGVTKATAAEFEAMKKVTKEIGATTEYTAKQAGEGLEFITKAGYDVVTSLKALPQIVDLATAGEIELAQAADIATNAMASMGIQVTGLSGLSDDFVTVINATKAGMDTLAESFRYAAPGASAFGYTMEQLLALLGQLAQSGVDGSMAGTQLSNAFIESAKYAKEAGLASSNFIDVLKHLNKEQATEVEIMDIFGDRAGRAALLLRNKIDAYEDLHKQLKNNNGETKELANIMRDNLGTSLTLLMSALDGLSKKLYEEVFRDDLKYNIEGMTNSIVEFTDSIVFLAQVIKIPFAAIGRLWDALQTIIYGINSAASLLTAFFFDAAASVYQLLEALSKVPTLSKIFGFNTGDDNKIIAFLQNMQSKFTDIAFSHAEKSTDNLYSTFFGEGLLKERDKAEKEMKAAIDELMQMKQDYLNKKIDSTNKGEENIDVVKQITKETREAYRKMYEDMDYYGKEWLDNEKELLNDYKKAMIQSGIGEDAAGKWVDDQLQKLTSQDGYNKRVDKILNNFFDSLDEEGAKLSDLSKLHEKYTVDKLQAYQSMYSDMQKYSKRNYQFEEKMIDLQIEQYRKAGIKEDELAALSDYKKRELLKQQLIDTEGFVGGMKSALMELQDEYSNFYKQIGELGFQTFNDIYKSFEDSLFYAMQGKFEELGDIWNNTWQNMKSNFLRILSQIAMQKIVIPIVMNMAGGTSVMSGAIGALGYSTLGNAIGLPQSNYSSLGAGVGGAIGSNWGAVGTVIGSIGGGLLGSLFGDDDDDSDAEKAANIQKSLKAFIDSMQNIIDVNTLSDWELSIKNLNKWYTDQVEVLKTLGVSTSQSSTYLTKLNEAYSLQVDALIESVENTGSSLEDFNNALSKLSDYINSVDDFITQMTTSSEFAPAVSYEQLQGTFNKLFQKASTGDTEALSSLFGYTQQTYLPFMQSYGDGGNYQQLFDSLFGANGMFSSLKTTAGDSLGEPFGLDYAELLTAIENQNNSVVTGSENIVNQIRQSTIDLITSLIPGVNLPEIVDVINDIVNPPQPDIGSTLNTLNPNQIFDMINQLAAITDISKTYKESDATGYAKNYDFGSWEEFSQWATGMGAPPTVFGTGGILQTQGYNMDQLNQFAAERGAELFNIDMAAKHEQLYAQAQQKAYEDYSKYVAEQQLGSAYNLSGYGNYEDYGIQTSWWDKIVTGISTYFTDKANEYSSLWEGVKSGNVSDMLKLLEKITVGGVPGFASGGSIYHPMLAQVGEKGQEYIVPSYNPERDKFLNSVGVDSNVIAELITSKLNGGSQHVTVQIDGKSLMDIIIENGKSDYSFSKGMREIVNG